jgi:hypothetical protein
MRRLRPVITWFLREHHELKAVNKQKYQLLLSDDAWLFIEFCIDITKVFNWVTNHFGSSKESCFSHMMAGYRCVAKHLTSCKEQLEELCRQPERRTGWVLAMIQGVNAAINKVQKYVHKVLYEHSDVVLVAVLLHPPTRHLGLSLQSHFDGWQRYFQTDDDDNTLYLKAVAQLKSVYKPYWENYDQSQTRDARSYANLTESIYLGSSP